MLKRDPFVWNVVIRGLVDMGLYEDARLLLLQDAIYGVTADFLLTFL